MSMKISKVTIRGTFSYDDNGQVIDGLHENNLNYLIGKNNVGKSNLGKALSLMALKGQPLPKESYHIYGNSWSNKAVISIDLLVDESFWDYVCEDVHDYIEKGKDLANLSKRQTKPTSELISPSL